MVIGLLIVALSVVMFLIGYGLSAAVITQLKYENERLGRELKRRSSRDALGRFTGGDE